jgi:hypothetical protein
MHRIPAFVLAALLFPVVPPAQNHQRPIVIRASTVLDGKGGVLRDVALVVQGTKIVRTAPPARTSVASRNSLLDRLLTNRCGLS